MRFYALGWREINAMPIYTFWELAKNVDRICAEEDSRLVVLLSESFAGEPSKFIDRLMEARGDIVEIKESVVVSESISRLKSLIGGV